jgi:hypothetical protein
MFPNAKGSEQLALLAVVSPASQSAGTSTSGWVSAAEFHSLLAIIQTGVMGSDGTLTAKLQQATDGSGTGAKDITGKVISVLEEDAGGSNRQVLIDIRCEELDTVNGFGFVQLSITTAVAASLVSAQILGVSPRELPATVSNIASVAQVI